VAVATQAIGSGGAFNAGLMAAQILALGDTGLQQRLAQWRHELSDSISLEVETCA
jgi:5-(carboxyamino)imidazole ribonucleotide mutase